MRKERWVLLLAGAAVAAVAGAATTSGATYAAFSDSASIHVTAEAGVWAPDPPAECGPISDYKGGVIYGTPGDDTLNLSGSNQRQIVMGYGGDDTIYGGNSGDCLVGGDGNDHLVGGNGKDILIGGAGDDYLDGGNGRDTIDAGGDAGDVCDGGNGHDTIVNCPIGWTP